MRKSGRASRRSRRIPRRTPVPGVEVEHVRASARAPQAGRLIVQARAIAAGFAKAIGEGRYIVHACSILPDHVHLVIRSHSRPYEQIVSHLKSRASQQLRIERMHPFEGRLRTDPSIRSIWAEGLWKCTAAMSLTFAARSAMWRTTQSETGSVVRIGVL